MNNTLLTRHSRKNTFITSVLLGSIAALISTPRASATSASWLGTTDALWALDTNWSNPFPVTGETATFNAASANVVIDLGAGVTVGNILFDTASAAAYTLGTSGSQSLTLDNGGAISLTSSVVTNQTINAALTLGNNGTAQTFTLTNASTTNSLTVAGGIIGSTGAGVKTLAVAGAGATTLSGVIGNGTTGSVALTKSGTGALWLSNTGNTFTGGVSIGAAAGTTTATTFNGTNVSGLGSGAVSIGAGSTLNLLSANTIATTTTINNTFTGSGLLKLTFTGTTNTNTAMNGLGGFAGNIQLSNTGVNGDKLNTNNNMGNFAGSLTVDSGSSIFATSNATTSFAGGISLSGTGNSENRGVIRLGSGVLGGNISLAGSSTIGLEGGYLTGNISAGVAGVQTLTFAGVPTGNGTLSGNISDGSGTVALTKSNTGTLWLTGTNTYTGATTISASGGRLQLGLGGTTGSISPSSAISVGAGASLTFNRSNAMARGTDFGAISGTGNVTQNGAGTTTFGGATVLAYTGITAVNRGTLALDFTALGTATDMVNASSILQTGGGTLSLLGKATGLTSQTFASTTGGAGASNVVMNRNGGTSVTLQLNALTRTAGNTITFQPATNWTTANSTTEIVKLTSATTPGGTVTLPGVGVAGYIGAGVYYLQGGATRYAQVLNTAGVYQLVAGPAGTTVTASTAANVTSAATVYTLANGTYTAAAPLTGYAFLGSNTTATTFANGGNTLTLNGYLGLAAGTTTISGAGSVIIGAERDLAVNLTSTGGLTISSVIANNGANASSVTNSSSSTGILTLSGVNTYSGGTFFNSGTTSIALDTGLGAVPGAATPGNLTFNGGTLSITPGAAVTINANRGITLGASGGTMTNTAGQTVTVSGIIAGVGGLTLNPTNASGAFTVSVANTYTGPTTLSGNATATIFIGNNSSFGGVGNLTLNGPQMRATSTANVTLANPVTIAANTTFVTVASEKSLIFNGPATLSGTRTLNSAVGTTVGGISVQFLNGISESTALSGLTKAGAGEIVLGGLNTFTGPTNISAGRLSYTKTFALYANTPASWTATNITVANAATLALRVGGASEFTSANVDTIAALGTATGGFQSGSYLGLDTTSGNFTYGTVLANTFAGANSVGLMKLGTNNLTLTAANTYTGITFIGGGTLVAANTAAFGAAGNDVYLTANTNATLPAGGQSGSGNIELATDTSANAYDIFGSSTFASSITVSRATSGAAVAHTLGQLALGANALTVQAGTNNASGTPSVSFSGLSLSAGGAGSSTLTPTTATIAITGPVNIGSGSFAKTLVLDGTIAGNAISGDITNGLNTFSLTKSNTSTWTLSGNNSYTGATTVSAGTLKAGSATGLSAGSAFIMADIAGAVLDLNNNTGTIGSLAGGGATGGNVTLGTGTLTTGDVTSTSYSGNISGAGNLVKVGAGSFTLATAQGYTGTTAVNGGTLLVNSTLASSATSVANTGTLGGTGTIANLVTVNSGGNLSPATATTAGTLTVASLTLDSGSNLAYEFGVSSDLVAVTAANGLTINGGAFSLYATGGATPLTTNGIYTLFSYVTGFVGAMTNLSVTNSQAGKTYQVADAGGTITLTIGTATTSDWSGTFGDGLWTSDGVGGNWNGGTAPNSLGAVANFGTLAGAPTAVTLSGGKTVGSLIFNNANAFTIGTTAAAITLDNGIAAGAISATTGSHTINAPIALNGPANITPGTGTAITFGGVISGTGKAVAFSGLGASTLSATNTYTGGTTINSGTVNLNNATAIGTGPLTIAGGTLDTTNGTTGLSTNNTQTWSGDFTFAGTSSFDLGTGAVSFGANRTVTVSANTLTVGGNVSGSIFGLTKQGAGALTLAGTINYTGNTTVAAGTLTLAGNNTYTGNTNVTGGTLNLTGTNTYTGNTTVTGGTLNITGPLTGNTTTTTLAYGTAAANTVVNVSNNMTLFNLTGANIAGSATAYNQTAGTVNISPIAFGAYVGNVGYGAFNLTGGTFKVNTGSYSVNGVSAIGGTGVAYVGGTGTLDLSTTPGNATIAYGGNGSLTVGPGGTVNRVGSTGAFWLATNANSYGIMNVAGGSFNLGASAFRVGNGAFTGITGFVNLASGTLTMGAVTTNTATSGNLYANYAGGTLKASATLNSPFSTGAGITTTSTIFGAIDNVGATQDFTGGLTVDTNTFNITYGNSLLGATGNGVKQADMAFTGGSGYIGAPLVQFTGGTLAANGTPASGYALISGGAVTGIVITSPGTYTVAPTITLTGGGGTGASVALSALTANAADTGLTKISAGSLILTGANTYTGTTTISGGTLQLGAAGTAGSLATTGAIVNNGIFAINRTDAVTQGTHFSAAAITGTGSLTQAGTGTTTLNVANSYSGGTTISGGILSVTNASALGGGAVTFSGSGVRLLVATGLDVANAITIGTNTGGSGRGLIEAGTVAGTATLSGPITITSGAAAGGHFAAPTAGTILHVSGAITSSAPLGNVSHRAGTVMFSGGGTGYATFSSTGVTMIGANNGLATTATVTIGASGVGTLDLNGFNQSLVGIVKGASAATIGNSSTTANSVLTTTGTSSYAGIIQDVIGSGTRTVGLTVASGALTLSGTNTYTGLTTVNNGTLNLSGSISGSATVDGATALLTSGATGTITGAVSTTVNGGTIAPGGTIGIGTLNTGALTLVSGSTLALEINSTSTYDKINVTGAVDLGSATLTLGGTYLTTPVVANDLFFIALNDGGDLLTTSFAGLSEGSHVYSSSGQDYLITYQADNLTTTFASFGTAEGNDVALLAVPEPAAAVSLISGLGMLLGLRRRRRA